MADTDCMVVVVVTTHRYTSMERTMKRMSAVDDIFLGRVVWVMLFRAFYFVVTAAVIW